jgi:hypothetical protein
MVYCLFELNGEKSGLIRFGWGVVPGIAGIAFEILQICPFSLRQLHCNYSIPGNYRSHALRGKP